MPRTPTIEELTLILEPYPATALKPEWWMAAELRVQGKTLKELGQILKVHPQTATFYLMRAWRHGQRRMLIGAIHQDVYESYIKDGLELKDGLLAV